MRLITIAAVCLAVASVSVVEAATNSKASSFDVNKGFSSIVEKLLPAVVSIQATQVVEQKSQGEGMVIPGLPGGPGMKMPGGQGNPLEELFRDFFEQSERPRKMQAVGSGFIIHCDKQKVAYVISNHHVVHEAKTITVVMEDKTEIPATLLASDSRNDVAVLKLDLTAIPENKRDLPTVEWADSDEVKAGDWVIAIGNPFNFGGTVTVGVVSYKGRYVPSGMQQDFEYIQHSAQINVGSSGGALFDTNGRVVGINNAIITNTGGNIGIGFAIPANVARQTADQLVKYGKTRRAHLGIRIQQMNKDMSESQGLSEPGIIVGSVVDDGPSDGKLEQGDIIVGFEGKKVTESHTLSRMVAATEIGKSITVKVIRNDKPIEVKIKVEEMPDQKEDEKKELKGIEKQSGSIQVAGLEIGEIPVAVKESLKENNKISGGVIVLGVDQSKDAADLFKRGDLIEQANHKALSSPKDFLDVVERAKKDKRKNILLLISRDGKPAYLPLRIEEDKSEEIKIDKTESEKVVEAPVTKVEVTQPKNDKKEEKLNEFLKNIEADKKVDEQKKVETDKQSKDVESAEIDNSLSAQKDNNDTKNMSSTEEEGVQDVDDGHGLDQHHDNSNVAKDAKSALKDGGSESLFSKWTDKIKSSLGMGG
jgi:serine protease Do